MLLKIRLYATGIVTLAIWALLAWDHYHGGVPSHHILADENLPSFSNWWGGLLLPLLTWWLLYRIQKRITRDPNTVADLSKYAAPVLYGFVGGLLYGILIAVFFTLGYSDPPGYMLLGLFPLALFFPIYRSECLLGFVLGMTFTFGGVLPIGIGSIFALIGAVQYLLVRPVILYLGSKLMGVLSANRDKAGQ